MVWWHYQGIAGLAVRVPSGRPKPFGGRPNLVYRCSLFIVRNSRCCAKVGSYGRVGWWGAIPRPWGEVFGILVP